MAAKIQGIPVYEALIGGDGTGMTCISLVDSPAVLTTWQKFHDGEQVVRAQQFAVADEERRIIRGVIMRADFPIYRITKNEQTGKAEEYYLIYRADTIRAMAEKYLADGLQNSVSLDHDGQQVEGVQMVQLYIKDTGAGINPEGFDTEIADGSLFAEFHVTNDDVWEQVKDGTFRGFSLEGLFAVVPEDNQRSIDAIVDELAGQFSITDMSKIERLKAILRAELAKEDNNKIERPEKFGAVTTDKGPLEWDGEDDLKAGDRVYIVDEDGNRQTAPDGDYTIEDGKVIVVVDGVVSEIRDAEAQVASEGDGGASEGEAEVEARKAEKMARVEKMSASYSEKMRRIDEAIRALLPEEVYGFLVDAGDDWAVFDSYGDFNNWGDTYTRYKVAWNGDEPSVSDPVEVRMAFVPMDFDDAAAFGAAPAASEGKAEAEEQMAAQQREVEELRQQLNDKQATIDTLTAELEAARKLPLAKPAHEEVKASEAHMEKTGNKTIDRVNELFGRA